MIKKGSIVISVIGLGYVGLPVAVAFGKENYKVIGFDISENRINELSADHDRTGEVSQGDIKRSQVQFSNNIEALKAANFHIITVPTPIDDFKSPDLSFIKVACEMLAKVIKKNDTIIIESTVFPGVTEEIVGPLLEKRSNLRINRDFSIGYSPERINPADNEHKFENIKKVVSASNRKALSLLESVYGSVVKAGIYKAPSIKVAEAAKVIENAQRDLNIAFMNELVKIFSGLNINTNEVLEAAETKWNFLPFRPGLVGGHCIGVDPYYLIHKSLQAGVIPDLIMSARKINDGMSGYFAQKIVKLLNKKNLNIYKAKILIMGISFKENCRDIRNSKVFDLISELESYKAKVEVFDPVVDYNEINKAYILKRKPRKGRYDLVVITVPHNYFKKIGILTIRTWCKVNGSVLDLKGTFPKNLVDHNI